MDEKRIHEMLETAHAKFKEGRLKQALQFYEQVLKKEANLEAMLESGRVLLELKEFEKAKERFEHGAKIQDESNNTLNVIYPFNYFAAIATINENNEKKDGRKIEETTCLEKVENLIRKSIRENEEFDEDERLFLLATILIKEGKFEPALNELRKISHNFERKKEAIRLAAFCLELIKKKRT